MDYELKVATVRLVQESSWYSESPLKNSRDVIAFMAKELESYDRELFCVLNLASDGKVINMNIVSMGSLTECTVNLREVFKCSIYYCYPQSSKWELIAISRRQTCDPDFT